MKHAQNMVRDFHRKFGHPAPDRMDPAQLRRVLRARLILEEAIEFAKAAGLSAFARLQDADGTWRMFEAIGEGEVSTVGMVDALADLAYVTLGGAVEMGIKLEPCFEAVHRSNMTKSAEKAPDGKTRKGLDYEPPRLDRVLETQRMAEEMADAAERRFFEGCSDE